MITEINWHIFHIKFHERQQKAFERLAYFLFCRELNLPGGVFRFKNQAGIETEPVQIETECVGFQAKFYEPSVALKKSDLVDSLEKAKFNNPGLTRILVYLNRELGENPKKGKKSPAYKADIEAAGQKLGITVDWRVASHLEQQLSLPCNHYLAEYFFSNGESIVDQLMSLDSHTNALLRPIRTGIRFGEQTIHVSRTDKIPQQTISEPFVTLFSGAGGCGKTALIKDWHATDNKPFYMFKATEFMIDRIDQLFGGKLTLQDFVRAHEEETEKTVVIDSAEKLSELINEEPFRELLSTLVENRWRLIFTTRDSYLEDLKYLFIRIYEIPFSHLRIDNLSEDELQELASSYKFTLPANTKLKDLIRNLFYLEEYLANYGTATGSSDVLAFRDMLWQRKIMNSANKVGNMHIRREQCFLKLARTRAEEGHLFIQPDGYPADVLKAIENDEIVAFAEEQGGYFITHDIYEEWGLEKLINSTFYTRTCNDAFFVAIGTSLPLRRAFRSWLSEKLDCEDDTMYQFTSSVINNLELPGFWHDEAIIAILLSGYAASLFEDFALVFLADGKAKLKKVIFLLRIACKEPDLFLYNHIIRNNQNGIDPAVFFTRPRGNGWPALFAFLANNIQSFNIDDLPFILPVCRDWDKKFGQPMLHIARFAYHFYDLIEQDEDLHFPGETEDQLIFLLMDGAKEITPELSKFFDAALLVKGGLRHHAYDKFCDAVLTDHEHFTGIAAAMPAQVMRLAEHLWFKPVAREHEFDFGGMGVEKYYSIRDRWHSEYSPVSAWQTPFFSLLLFHLQAAVDFFIEFTNKTAEAYSKADLEVVSKINFTHPDGETSEQYGTSATWCIYRGYSSPTTPNLLECLHMALEKRLLEMADQWKPETVSSWLFYLLKKTRAVSVTAVVTSVVLAHPEKFFSVAALLFTVPEFFTMDNYRQSMEGRAKGLYGMWQAADPSDRPLSEERLATCEQPHRKNSLEELARNLQFFKDAAMTDDAFVLRRQQIWEIIDGLIGKVDNISDTEEQITGRMLIVRLDGRKMNPTETKMGEYRVIEFKPDLAPELQVVHDEAMAMREDMVKHVELRQWAEYHFDSRVSKAWPKYENNPDLVLKETREVISQLEHADESFWLRNHALPSYTCYALLKLHADTLTPEDLEFCRYTVVAFAGLLLRENYNYQMGDGVEVAINAVPLLYPLYPELTSDFSALLLLCVFDDYPIGGQRFGDYVIDGLHRHLYILAPEAANRIFWGYLHYKPKFNAYARRKPGRGVRTFAYRRSQAQLVQAFFKRHQKGIMKLDSDKINAENLDWASLSLADWDTGLKFVPQDSQDPVYFDFVKRAVQTAIPKLVISRHMRSRDDHWDYALPHRFFRRFARFLLNRSILEIDDLTIPLVNNFAISEEMADLFGEILSAADEINNPTIFWKIWERFYELMVRVSKLDADRNSNVMIHNYLLGYRWWSNSVREWHTLRLEDKAFYKKASQEMGSHPATIYSIAKVLNDIGSAFLDDGVGWIATILRENPGLENAKPETNTVYYLELICRKYVYSHRSKLRMHRLNGADVLVIIDFLVRKGSVSAYLLREDII